MKTDFYIPQTERIRNVIHSTWQIQRFGLAVEEQIIPKGVVEIIFNLSDGNPVHARLGNQEFDIKHSIINGFNRLPIKLRLPGQQEFFGIRFQPLAIKKFFGVAASEFSDVLIDLTLVDPAIHSLWHELAEQNSFAARVETFCKWIDRKTADLQPRESMINDFLCASEQHEWSVKELAGSLCYSTKQLSRKVFEATGMNNEEILLYKKYLHAVHLVHHTDLSLTAIAHQSNFYDQSHFIRSFKSYTHMTPGDYKNAKGHVAGHILQNVH